VSLRAAIAAPLDERWAWWLLRALADRIRAGDPVRRRTGLTLGVDGQLRAVAPEIGSLWVDPRGAPWFGSHGRIGAAASNLLELYLPLCLGDDASALVVAHLGQSLDGQIATATGASRYVTGRENLMHIHRLRALCDAVVVGAETVERDDPQLTTRLVVGPSPARVVIDPGLRVSATRQIYTNRQSRTIVVCAQGASARSRLDSSVEMVEVPRAEGGLDPVRIVEALGRAGLSRLFVEGGGVTVSRFLQAGALHRLHVTISPMIIGAGRPGLAMPSIDVLEHAIRPRARRFDMGDDVLFDCELDATPASSPR
jgi:riboflavin-specific deaminase-like protein